MNFIFKAWECGIMPNSGACAVWMHSLCVYGSTQEMEVMTLQYLVMLDEARKTNWLLMAPGTSICLLEAKRGKEVADLSCFDLPGKLIWKYCLHQKPFPNSTTVGVICMWSAVSFYYRKMHVSTNDGRWHHICFTWRGSDGNWKFYKNGILYRHGWGFKRGYFIRSRGSLVLAQEQDSVGGRFDATQSFQGALTNVNVWSYVLWPRSIKWMSKSCLRGRGNVYKWSDFRVGVKGGTRVYIPTHCRPLGHYFWVFRNSDPVFSSTMASKNITNVIVKQTLLLLCNAMKTKQKVKLM